MVVKNETIKTCKNNKTKKVSLNKTLYELSMPGEGNKTIHIFVFTKRAQADSPHDSRGEEDHGQIFQVQSECEHQHSSE